MESVWRWVLSGKRTPQNGGEDERYRYHNVCPPLGDRTGEGSHIRRSLQALRSGEGLRELGPCAGRGRRCRPPAGGPGGPTAWALHPAAENSGQYGPAGLLPSIGGGSRRRADGPGAGGPWEAAASRGLGQAIEERPSTGGYTGEVEITLTRSQEDACRTAAQRSGQELGAWVRGVLDSAV